jgi:hypothetical protein
MRLKGYSARGEQTQKEVLEIGYLSPLHGQSAGTVDKAL